MKNVLLFIVAGLLIPALVSAKKPDAVGMATGTQAVASSSASTIAATSTSFHWPTTLGTCGKITQSGGYASAGSVQYWDAQNAQWQYKWQGENMVSFKLNLSDIDSPLNVRIDYGTSTNNLNLSMATRTLSYVSPYGLHSVALGYYVPVITNQRYYYRIAIQNMSSTYEYLPALGQKPCSFFAKLYMPSS
jgi:hypothetical protein